LLLYSGGGSSSKVTARSQASQQQGSRVAISRVLPLTAP
jgi:hypothetical protein